VEVVRPGSGGFHVPASLAPARAKGSKCPPDSHDTHARTGTPTIEAGRTENSWPATPPGAFVTGTPGQGTKESTLAPARRSARPTRSTGSARRPARTWVFAPDSGGKPITEPVKRRTEERLRRH